MKRLFALFLVISMVISIAACGGSQSEAGEDAEGETITVFAAASLTEALTELAAQFEAEHPGVTIEFNFDSSGTLKTQIEEGAVCDVFISAAEKQMDQLDINASPEVNVDGLDYVLEGSRFDFLENNVVLVVPEGNPADINSFEDMFAGLQDRSVFMTMGNSDVPAGQYAGRIFEYFNVSEEAVQSQISYGTNVREISTQVLEGAVDCGILYQTDAYSDGLTVVDTAPPDMCGQVIYPAAVINGSEHADMAQAFLDFIRTAEAAEVFSEIGFSVIIE